MGELIKFNSERFQKLYKSNAYDYKRYLLIEKAYIIAERMNKKEEKCKNKNSKH